MRETHVKTEKNTQSVMQTRCKS